MKNVTIMLAIAAGVVLAAGTSASAGLAHYWSCNVGDDDLNGWLGDTARDYGVGTPGLTDYPAQPVGALATNPATRSAGADGTANGAVQVYTNGSTGADVGYNTSLTNMGSVFTWEMMIRYDALPYRWSYFTNRNGAQVGPGLTVVHGDASHFGNVFNVNIGGTNSSGLTWAPSWGSWYLLAVTGDGTTAHVYATKYNDPGAATIELGNFACSTAADGTIGLSIGNVDSSRYGPQGWVDWTAVWDVALTPEQLWTHNVNDSPIPTGPQPASLTIKKFFDCDQNGVKDYSDDNLLPNWVYHITGPSGYDQTLTTDGTGQIALTGLDAGDYTVTETVWKDHAITTGNQGKIITLAGGDNKTEMFGNVLNGDINQDGTVDSIDFTILKANYGLTPKTWVQGNLNPGEDTLVDGIDFTILKAYYGQGVQPGPAGVPEPAALTLLVIGGLGLLRRRR